MRIVIRYYDYFYINVKSFSCQIVLKGYLCGLPSGYTGEFSYGLTFVWYTEKAYPMNNNDPETDYNSYKYLLQLSTSNIVT